MRLNAHVTMIPPPRVPPLRARLVLALLAGGFGLLLVRSLWLQGVDKDFLREQGESRYARVLEVPANRGRILDRNGEPLAVSAPVKSIWAIPDEVKFADGGAERLARLLGMSPRELRRRAEESGRDFVYLRRQIPPEAAAQAAALNIPGIFQSREYRRYYPSGEVTAHVVGFTDVDDAGKEGIELEFQDQLAGRVGSRRVIRDRMGRIVEDVESIQAAQPGRDVQLALDSRIQHVAYTSLKEAVLRHHAKGGGIVVLDSLTGEVLALANYPAYNPNNRTRIDAARVRNRAVTDAFEPGSTLKPFTIALAWESGTVNGKTMIQTAPGTFAIGPALIHDAHPSGMLSVAQVIQKSSNVGAAKIALELPRHEMGEFFARLGFGAIPHLGFPGEATGHVRPYARWRPIEQATMAYGHGISVSLIQLAHAYLTFARGGDIVPLSLLKIDTPPPATRIVSEATARAVRSMLELVVQPEGTAPRAQIMGYRVAGKTGTAHKLQGGTYAPDKYIASFVGFAPASKPRLVIAVMIDEPSPDDYYGGTVAAPAFAQVMAGSLRILGVPNDAPMEPVELPPAGSEIKESV